MKTISIVTPCFNEEAGISDCHQAVARIFAEHLPGYRREHVFCDNNSSDATPDILRGIAAEDPCVKVILNARNFGPMRSNYNGVMAAGGDAVLLFLPADLQDPPSLLPEFVRLWEAGYEVVYGIRRTRDEGRLMRTARGLYYRTLVRMSDFAIPPGVGDFQLVDRKVIEAMREIEDAYPFLRMMTFECGFRAVGVPYHWAKRRSGMSKNTLLHLIDQGMNGLTTFTLAPVRMLLVAGLGVAIAAILYALANLVIGLLFYRELAQPGVMTIVTAVFFFGGIQLFSLGVLGEYVLAIHAQVRRKPVVFERERINFKDDRAGR